MENRVDLDVKADHLVTSKEVEEKLTNMSGSGFENLFQQSEYRHQEFSALVASLRSSESTANKYYSTKILQKKILQGLATEYKVPEQADSLSFIQQKHDAEYGILLKSVKQTQEEYKERIRSDLMVTKNALATIEKMREPLIARINQFKNALIDTLILAAKEYQVYLKKNCIWNAKKFIEFSDKFGCVVKVNRKNPSQLDNKNGYGLKFGHKIREAYQLPGVELSLEILRKSSLDDIVEMINNVIAECAYYSGDSYYSLQIIKNHFDQLARNWRGYFRLEEEGHLYKYLKTFKLTQSEEEMINKPMKIMETEFKKSIIDQDVLLQKGIVESLSKLQEQAAIEKKNTDEYAQQVKQELRIAVNLLSGPAEKCYKQIAVRNANMKIFNAEARTHGIVQVAALHRVQSAYEDAIRMAKLKEQAEFTQHEKKTIAALQEAEEAMKITKDRLESLQKAEKSNRNELNYAKEHYDGSCQRILEAELARESKKYEKRKSAYIEGQKEYNEVRFLPKALKAYGEIVFSCAEIQDEIAVTHQVLKEAPITAQSMWTAYHDALLDAKFSKTDGLDNQKQTIDLGLSSLREEMKKSSEKISAIKLLKDSVESKLQEVKKEFSLDVHEEHQEIFDLTNMQYSDVFKRYEKSQSILSSVQKMPGALYEYTGIISHCAVIQKPVAEARRAAITVQGCVLELEKVYNEACKLAECGVVKKELKAISEQKYIEAERALSFATANLNEAEVIILAEQKKLAAAKMAHSSDMHTKPQVIFDELNNMYSDTVVVKRTAEAAFASSKKLSLINEKLAEAASNYKQKQIAGQLRQIMLNAVLNNLHLWHIGKWGGGVNYSYNGKNFRIPHGVLNLITALSTITDNKKCLAEVGKMAREREVMGVTQWKYRFFNIRDDRTTGVLYHALQTIKSPENLTETSIETLVNELSKINELRLEKMSSRNLALLNERFLRN